MLVVGYVLQLGTEGYDEILRLQHNLQAARRKHKIPDTVIFLEHTDCFTIGSQGGGDHILVGDAILKQEGVEVYETDRGGDVTYHGPGQLVCYPIMDLNQYGRDVHVYARNLEEVIIRTLNDFGIIGYRKKNYPGVWVGRQKIAAQGIAVNHWVTMHGVSINVCPGMKHFFWIVPCGLMNYGVISMKECLGKNVAVKDVAAKMCVHFGDVFKIELKNIEREEITRLIDDDVTGKA